MFIWFYLFPTFHSILQRVSFKFLKLFFYVEYIDFPNLLSIFYEIHPSTTIGAARNFITNSKPLGLEIWIDFQTKWFTAVFWFPVRNANHFPTAINKCFIFPRHFFDFGEGTFPLFPHPGGGYDDKFIYGFVFLQTELTDYWQYITAAHQEGEND